MGRAKRNPSLPLRLLMGFASLNPSYALPTETVPHMNRLVPAGGPGAGAQITVPGAGAGGGGEVSEAVGPLDSTAQDQADGAGVSDPPRRIEHAASGGHLALLDGNRNARPARAVRAVRRDLDVPVAVIARRRKGGRN